VKKDLLEKRMQKAHKVSVIIPCYNQGKYLDEALKSVLAQTLKGIEIIIVDDGSTDSETRDQLERARKRGIRVVRTANQGLAAARNNGIREASGEYILPLDADDKIGATYLENAATVLDRSAAVGIVYCLAETFGEVQGPWPIPPYSLEQMLLDNIIFCSAMFRKRDWEQVGGYDSQMKYGWEDYDFWLSLIERGVGVYRIPEVLFFYRVSAGSMVRTKSLEQKVEMFVRVFQKHRRLFEENIDVWLRKILRYPDLERLLMRSGSALTGLERHAAQLERELQHLKQAPEWRLAWRLARFFWKLKRYNPFSKQGG